MRKLISHDVFVFSRLIKKLGMKQELKKILDECNTVSDVYAKGYELIYALVEFATTENAEKELYHFLAPIFEVDEKSFETMPLDDLLDGFHEIANNNNVFRFFKHASALMK